jgi:hypothetical protein
MLIPLIDRIQLDEKTGCWNWRGAKLVAGYGQASYRGKKVTAHRLAAFLWLQHPLDSPLLVLHRCDNPSCFNPKHLFIGTQSDNLKDAIKKGRWTSPQKKKTHCPKGHPYDETNTLIDTKSGYIHRICRACTRKTPFIVSH